MESPLRPANAQASRAASASLSGRRARASGISLDLMSRPIESSLIRRPRRTSATPSSACRAGCSTLGQSQFFLDRSYIANPQNTNNVLRTTSTANPLTADHSISDQHLLKAGIAQSKLRPSSPPQRLQARVGRPELLGHVMRTVRGRNSVASQNRAALQTTCAWEWLWSYRTGPPPRAMATHLDRSPAQELWNLAQTARSAAFTCS